MKQAIGFDQPIPQEITPTAILEQPTPAPRNVPEPIAGTPLLPEQMVAGQEYVAFANGIRCFQGQLKANPKICSSPIMRIAGRPHRIIRLEAKNGNYYLGFEHNTHFFMFGSEPKEKLRTVEEINNEKVEYHSTYVGMA